MIYKNLKIQAFRGIKELTMEGFSNVNLILGQNNSGKSSILEAVFILTGYNNPQLSLNVDLFRNLAHNELEDFRFIYYNLDYNSKLVIEADLFRNSEHRKLEIIPKESGKEKAVQKVNIKTNSSSSENENSKSTLDTSDKKIDTLEFKAEIKRPHTERRHYVSSMSITKTSPDGIEFTIDNRNTKGGDFKALYHGVNMRNQNELIKRLEKLLISKKKEELIKSLKFIENKITDIITTKNSMVFVDVGAERMLPSNLMGDGFFKYLSLITQMFDVKDGVMLIDEIENGLHFSSLKNLWRIILHYSEEYNIQVFITTHSKEALLYLKDVLEESEMLSFQNKVKCFTISKLKDDIVKAYPYDFTSFEYAVENDVEIRGEI